MHVRDVMSSPLVTAAAQLPISAVARLMAQTAVGAVVVVEDHGPVGIVTDRDIVVRGLASGLSAQARIDSVMSADLVTVAQDDPIEHAYEVFRRVPFRRLPVTAPGKKVFVGILTVDDLMLDVSRRITGLARPVAETVLPTHAAAGQ